MSGSLASNDAADPILENVSSLENLGIRKPSIKSSKEGLDERINKENQNLPVNPSEPSAVNNGSDNTDLDEWLTNAFHKHLEKVIYLIKSLNNRKKTRLKPNVRIPLKPQAPPTTTTCEHNSSNSDFVSVVYEDHESNNEKQKLLDHIDSRKRRRETLNDSSSTDTAELGAFHQLNVIKTKKVFLATGIPSAQRPYVRSVIERLGGKFVYGDCWDYSCTHIIIGRPNRTEKCLAACASGTWFLTFSFIKASDAANEFVDETVYECKESDFKSKEEQQTIRTARKWRNIISSQSKLGIFYI